MGIIKDTDGPPLLHIVRLPWYLKLATAAALVVGAAVVIAAAIALG